MSLNIPDNNKWIITTLISAITFLIGIGVSSEFGKASLRAHTNLPGHPVMENRVDRLEKDVQAINKKLDLIIELQIKETKGP